MCVVGGKWMNLAKWTCLFITTVAWGIGAAMVIGLFVLLTDPGSAPFELGMKGFVYNVAGTAVVGALLGTFSHMGFFAYLTLNYFAQGIIRSRLMWSYVQIFVVIVVSVYSVMLRVREGESFVPYMVLPSIVIAVAAIATYAKVKQTNVHSTVPSLFFLIAVTLLEAVPALRQYNPYGSALMVGPLLACNVWQLMLLHRLLGKSAPSES